MKTPLYGLNGQKRGDIDTGRAFSAAVRADLIQRAFLSERSRQRQPYGADPLAGKRTSAHYHGLRHYKYTMMNKEMARISRIHGQGYLNYTARFVPQAIKGRKAHPPKAEKIWTEKMNKKEWQKALWSALAATANTTLVEQRGHLPGGLALPVVVSGLEQVKKTKEVEQLLVALGLEKELDRASERKVRAGKGKRRGRKYVEKKGPLIVTGKGSTLPTVAGTDCVTVDKLTVADLAPGSAPGRLCVWSEKAVEELRDGK